MKKLTSLLLVLAMCLSLVACGGPDKQPAIDAFNSTSKAFNAVAKVINDDLDAYPEELVDGMIDMSNLLGEYQELLSSDKEIAEEDLNAMIEWFGDVDAWVADVKEEFEME